MGRNGGHQSAFFVFLQYKTEQLMPTNKYAFLFLMAGIFILLSACKKDDGTDKNKPFIKLLGPDPLTWNLGVSPYADPGAEAWDITANNDTINISDRLVVSENVDVNTAGDYEVRFNVSDEAGNDADEVTRLVKVRLTK